MLPWGLSSFNNLGVLSCCVLVHGIAFRFDKLLSCLVVGEFPIADVLARAGCPDLIFKPALLAVIVLECAIGVQTRVELALGLDVSESAALGFAVGAIAA